MSWKKSFLFVGILSLLFTAVPASAEQKEDIYLEVKELLSELHISGKEVEDFQSDSIEGLLTELDDPYTDYFTSEEWKSFQSGIEQQYVGVGIRISQDNNGIYVVEVFEGSPAKTGGILPGDYIIKVNEESMEGKGLDDLTSRVMGLENTAVTLTVLRDGEEKEIHLIRKAIRVPSVTGNWFERDLVGYIKVSSFSLDANKQFDSLMDQYNERGMRALLLDLRDNPGGYLNTAKLLAKHFIQNGPLMHTLDRDKEDTPVRIVGGKKANIPVYVLVNEGSASASEVLAGALQDYGVAKVIGTQTYGKGSVQSSYMLSDGSVLKLTVEEYFTPNRHQVNQVGIKPDIEVYGAVSQLITALRLAGVNEFELRVERTGWSLNDVSFSERIHILEQDGNQYVQARILAALTGETIAWDGLAKEVLIGNSRFKADTEQAILEYGVNYLNLEQFQKQFPAFRWWSNEQGWGMYYMDEVNVTHLESEDEAA